MDELEWVRQAILRAYPNPHRMGCPPPEALEAMGRKTLPMTKEEEDHIYHCSPCFGAYLAVRNQVRRSRLIRVTSFCAAGVLLLGLAAYWGYRTIYPATAPQHFAATFNLRDRPVFRGPQPAIAHSDPFVLPRGIVHLSVTLPLGSEPGRYHVETLRVGQVDPVLRAEGQAVSQADGSTILTVDVNSTNLGPGQYDFRVRKDDTIQWRHSLVVRQ